MWHHYNRIFLIIPVMQMWIVLIPNCRLKCTKGQLCPNLIAVLRLAWLHSARWSRGQWLIVLVLFVMCGPAGITFPAQTVECQKGQPGCFAGTGAEILRFFSFLKKLSDYCCQFQSLRDFYSRDTWIHSCQRDHSTFLILFKLFQEGREPFKLDHKMPVGQT